MENLIVYQKMLETIEYGYVCVRQFPRSEKHGLAADIKAQMYKVLNLIIRANKRYFKKTTMQDLDIEHEVLRKQVEIAMRLRFLPFRQFEIMAGKINEVGRLIGAWKKKI
jgi:hypothetical protein